MAGRTLISEGPEVRAKLLCTIQNGLLHSNDLTQSAWVAQSGLTSVVKTATDPYGVANNANRVVGGGANNLIFRQTISVPGDPLSVGEHLCVSGWVQRVSGDRLIEFDVGDGSTPNTRRIQFPDGNGVWQFFFLMCEAGGNSWFDINFPTGTGDATFDFYALQLNEGSIPFLYKETTASVQGRDTELREVKQSDLWRVGNEIV